MIKINMAKAIKSILRHLKSVSIRITPIDRFKHVIIDYKSVKGRYKV
jgi:hypothetical protein